MCRISPCEQSSIMDEVRTFPVLGAFRAEFGARDQANRIQEPMEIITEVFRMPGAGLEPLWRPFRHHLATVWVRVGTICIQSRSIWGDLASLRKPRKSLVRIPRCRFFASEGGPHTSKNR